MIHRIPVERVAHETLDGEVVILDQASGTYFSLTGAGADIWALIAAGASLEAIAGHLAERFHQHDGRASEAVRALADELVREGLLELVAGEPSSLLAPPAGPAKAWVAPRLERFTDLQSLLLLDPIHDVDESGWPHQAP